MQTQQDTSTSNKWTPIGIMLAVLFVLAPLYYHPNIGGEGLRVPNNITTWMVVISIISYSFFKLNSVQKITLPNNFKLLILAPVLITLSGFLAGSEKPIDWLFRIITVWGGLLFFLALLQENFMSKSLDKVLSIILLSAFVQGVIGVSQVYLLTDWSNSVIPQADLPEGMFQQINNHITYQTTAIFIAFYLLTRDRVTKVNNMLPMFFLVMVIVQSSFLIGLSDSRIGWLSLIIGLLCVCTAVFNSKCTIDKKSFSMLLAILFISLSVGFLMSSGRIGDKTEAMTSGYSGDARLGIYSLSMDLVKEKPIVGHGIGSFSKVWQNGKPEFYNKHPDASLPNSVVTHPHNEFLYWFVEGGILAVLALVIILTAVVKALHRMPLETRYMIVALLLPVALHTQVEAPFYISNLHYFMFVLLLTLPYQQQNYTMQINMSIMAKKSLSAVIIIVFLFGQSYLVHSMKANRDLVNYYVDMKPENRQLLEYPLANPFFSHTAMWLMMRESLYTSIKHNDLELIKSNIKWTEQELLDNPNVELYFRLINAYSHLQDTTTACIYVNRALAMFPDQKQLDKFKKVCGSDLLGHKLP